MTEKPKTIEIIKDQLYFLCVDDGNKPQDSAKAMFFTLDEKFVYTSFFADFGPLDLGLTYTFCEQLQQKINQATLSKKALIFYCTSHLHQRSNSAFLLCAFLVFVLNYSAEEAYRPFIGINPPFAPFRDAAFCINTFPLTVLDCVRGIAHAVAVGHYYHPTFSPDQFKDMAKLQNGDFSWIVPGKFLAFSGPISRRREISPGVFSLLPQEYVPIMKRLGVTCIVRFNSKCYDRNVFTAAGIRHVDLYYEDGGNPTETILQTFLQVCEAEKGSIAVHCKAGLGRTGTNIAAYMMKHYGYSARDTIAWCRICRPGSVVGPQQQYLLSIEEKMKHEGEIYRSKHHLNAPPTAPMSGHANASRLRSVSVNPSLPSQRPQHNNDVDGASDSINRCSTPPISGPGSDSGTRPSSIRASRPSTSNATNASSSLFKSAATPVNSTTSGNGVSSNVSSNAVSSNRMAGVSNGEENSRFTPPLGNSSTRALAPPTMSAEVDLSVARKNSISSVNSNGMNSTLGSSSSSNSSSNPNSNPSRPSSSLRRSLGSRSRLEAVANSDIGVGVASTSTTPVNGTSSNRSTTSTPQPISVSSSVDFQGYSNPRSGSNLASLNSNSSLSNNNSGNSGTSMVSRSLQFSGGSSAFSSGNKNSSSSNSNRNVLK